MAPGAFALVCSLIDGDGCSHQCREERCGNGTLDPHEECDDFNTACGDG